MAKKFVKTDQAPAPIGPYSQAIWAGNILFLSGQIAIDPATGELVNDSIEAETLQVMHNIKAVLEAAGLSFPNIVKSSIFLNDMDNFSKVNGVYGQFFEDCVPPARECVEVSQLPKSVSVEISIIASK